MNVSLTPELERWVQAKLTEGLYQSASELVREALRIMVERERLQAARVEELRRDLRLGLEQLDRGEGIPFDQALIEKIDREGRARLKLS